MQSQPPFSHFAGLDWAKDHHDVVILDTKGHKVDTFRFEHSAAGWRRWQKKISAFPDLAVAIETSAGMVVGNILDSGVAVYPVNPFNAKRYRERHCSSGNKTDEHDAWSLADALRVDGHDWKALTEQDPVITELRLLCRDEVSLIEQRTALINQLQQALYEYYPTALEAFDDWTKPFAWKFVVRFPTPQKLSRAGRSAWEKWLHSHELARPQTYTRRLDLFAKALEFNTKAPVVRAKSLLAVALAKQLSALESQLAIYRERIEEIFAQHPDNALFGSLPGAGPKLAPRLLSEIGSDRALFEDAQGLQCLAGTAPVHYQSGKVLKVRMRRACNKSLRHSIHLFADKSRAKCPWASIYYNAHRERGKTHSDALRCLAQRWLKIIWKMWQTGTPYNGEHHLRNQMAHGSWLFKKSP